MIDCHWYSVTCTRTLHYQYFTPEENWMRFICTQRALAATWPMAARRNCSNEVASTVLTALLILRQSRAIESEYLCVI